MIRSDLYLRQMKEQTVKKMNRQETSVSYVHSTHVMLGSFISAVRKYSVSKRFHMGSELWSEETVG